jgi:catechol 2,3-dioxygenase-like lactoylglutathione lyase family enzyme
VRRLRFIDARRRPAIESALRKSRTAIVRPRSGAYDFGTVIIGVHAIIFTSDAEADRAFFREVLDLPSVDAGEGWLIFALPPAELAAHPTDGDAHHELYLMCEDVRATIEELRAKGVEFTKEISDEGFGLLTKFRLPGGSEIALYEPRHPSPISSTL